MSAGKSRNRRAVSKATKSVVPTFQSAPIVLAALHSLAKKEQQRRHVELLTNCMGHLLVMSDAQILRLYDQALALAWGARSISGLESFVLTGMQTAACAGDATRVASLNFSPK